MSAASNVSQTALRSVLSVPTKFFKHFRRADEASIAEQQMPISARQSTPHQTIIPGPWAFVTSGYAITLVLMALLLNRIQHIVVPPRQSLLRRLARHYAGARPRQSTIQTLISLLLPLNFNSTMTRTLSRLPSVYLLWRSLLLLTVMLLQTCDLFPSVSWLKWLAGWSAGISMKDACWATFLSICVALAVEALMRGLEGRVHPSSPFNLFSYAFLLHIYSSPTMHVVSSSMLPSRPDRHVLVTIIIPLFQLTLIQTISIRKKWANQRLIPTTICGLLNLIHFHYVVFFSSTHYPLINYVSSVLETALLMIILLTLSLHILTQILSEGRVTRPFFGSSPVFLLRWDEDFSVAILRLGTASLDATSAAGLGNELAGINVNSAELELDRGGVVDIRHGSGYGFQHEIKQIRVPSNHEADSWVDTTWIREWERFLWGIWRCLKAFYRSLTIFLQKNPATETLDVLVTEPSHRDESENDIYSRFLRGDNISDDDEDYNGPEESAHSSRSSSVGVELSEDHIDGDSRGMLFSTISDSAIAPVLLAHVGNQTPTPLTRRRYRQMASEPDDDWRDILKERRLSKPDIPITPEDDERRRNCVICTVEQREIIFWPCRCLALCEECRVNLASRLPASKHTCPCCRRNVDGYSRVYIP